MEMIDPWVRDTFVELCSVVSRDAGPVLSLIKPYLEQYADEWGYDDVTQNLWARVGNGSTAFTCHTDTVSHLSMPDIEFRNNGTVVGMTEDTTSKCLGADDRAGIVVLLHMLRKGVTGYYYFFGEEETKRKGSQAMAGAMRRAPFGMQCNWDKMVSFDRGGFDEIITHQARVRTCSDDFAIALADELNMAFMFDFEPSQNGGRTDSASFAKVVPECTNVSVGYLDQHTPKETQCLEHLAALCEAVIGVNWGDLPVVRDPMFSEILPKPEPVGTIGFHNAAYLKAKQEVYDSHTEWVKSGHWPVR